MNASWSKKLIAAGVAVICAGGLWAAQPAEAETDVTGGGHDAASTGQVIEIDAIVALRKQQMAHDYVEYAAFRAQGTRHR